MRRVKTQASLFFSDVWQNKWSFLFGLVQVLLALLLTGYMLSLAQTGWRTIEAFEHLQKLGSVYHIGCIAEAGQIEAVTNDDSKTADFEAIYRYISDMEETETFTADASMKIFLSAEDTEAEDIAADNMYGMMSFRTLRVTEGFFDAFPLEMSVEKGRLKEAFRQYYDDGVMPVLLGDSYRKYYQEDEIFADSDGKEYRVLGFLREGSVYAAPFESERARILDDWMIVPLGNDRQGGGIGYITELTSTYFITDREDLMEELVQEFKKRRLLPFEYLQLSDQVKSDIEDLKNEALTMGSVMILILAFATTGMVSRMVRFVRNRMKEFAVHLLTGAGIRDVMLRIAMQLCVILLLSDIVVFAVFGVGVVSFGILLFSILYGVAVSAYPLYLFRTQKIADVLRKNGEV